MDLDPLFISRLQFAFTIIFHIIFPTFTIGLSAYIATLCVMWMRSGKERTGPEFGTTWAQLRVAHGYPDTGGEPLCMDRLSGECGLFGTAAAGG